MMASPTASFHPAVAAWFERSFATPTAAQAEAWPAIQAGRHVLIAAPTGSGKTLAAFLAALDGLVRQGLAGELRDETQIVYVSPLKALSNDIRKNLEAPLAGIREELRAQGLADVEIRSWVRTGDTPAGERQQMGRRPPHIVVTTPESLYILLGSQSGRAMLKTTRTVIVDEIHAVAANKRGSHLAVSLERLSDLAGDKLLRIGLSATQKPIETVARFLVGAGGEECTIVDTGHRRARDLAIEVPSSPLEAVMSGDVWHEVYDRLAELVREHRTTLVFVNTRRLVERVTRHLSERLGAEDVAAHHGSLAKELRLDAEQRLKAGALRALVATASLELGIDIGEVDLVCQLGSPRAIATFLQRVGRSGHAVDGTPKGRLFPLSRDELVECAALLDSVRRGELDRLTIPKGPLDVLAQQIVAEVAAQEWSEDALYALFRRSWPFRDLRREDFDAVIAMLAGGFTTRRGRRGALIHHDGVNRRLRERRGARLVALTSGGTIPDNADYQVMLEPENQQIGTVNEDFAVESLAGDIFQLGNTSYRILRVERGTVRVADAEGLAPNIPFWLGEAPGRSDELSRSVSRLREGVAERLLPLSDRTSALSPLEGGGEGGDLSRRGEEDEVGAGGRGGIPHLTLPSPPPGAERGLTDWLVDEVGVAEPAADQVTEYLAAARAALGVLPTHDTIVIERFFDAVGGMQLVVHSPYGSRVNRAWGLALRKRFCRKFNFEIQAAATEDNIVLSLTTAHSFDLAEVQRYLHSASVRQLLTEALLDAPMFMTRWRWVAGVALSLPRFRGGKKVPPPLLRMDAEDLLAGVFPDQIACAENLAGAREIPDHPLVRQTIADCLDEAMDAAGLERLLAGIEAGDIRVIARDLTEPSPLALEVLSARPYAYLDDAPLEERRTQAVMARRWLAPEEAEEIGRLDPQAIERVREEAWPDPANADELHDALDWLGFVTADEARAEAGWNEWLACLAAEKRVARLLLPQVGSLPQRTHPSAVMPGLDQGIHATALTAKTSTEEEDKGVDGRDKPGHDDRTDVREGPVLWITAERLPLFRALWPDAGLDPPIVTPAAYQKEWPRDEALVEILRGRLDGQGPATKEGLARALRVEASEIAAPLAALEAEGFALRGHFTPGAEEEEWCERRLLARIHRYTIGRLRAEIEPVAARDFLRFLLEWQRAAPDARMEGPDALEAVIGQLEGFQAPAGAWETEILPARLADYEPAWLDDQCLAGRVAWARLRAPSGRTYERGASPVRSTPIALLPRRHVSVWASLSPSAEATQPSAKARAVADCIREHGASFFDELVEGAHLLAPQVEEALAELVAIGVVNSDSFAGLRALLVPSEKRSRRRRRRPIFGMADAGRWALARRGATRPAGEIVEHIARALLRRYGVVFWRMLEREAPWLPPWRELLRVYRRLEARGEIRGGRFIAGLTGEQFALPEAIAPLRAIRNKSRDGSLVSVCGADPLNLVGHLLAGTRVPNLTSARVLFRDGAPIATLVAGEFTAL
ncbi:MAG TPA: DEAD/DEAH box helicase, partial [Stellaceae bacterium]|nr:DEAD/DEAH box helicase [Stellaceae bacterium]